jgi:hypothetical protein
MNSEQASEIDDTCPDSVRDLLAPLKEIQPSEGAIARLREIVDRETRRPDNQPVESIKPWWSRSVSVPVPVLISLALLMAVLLTWPDRQPSTEKPKATITESPQSIPSEPQIAQLAEPQIQTNEMYLCGIGQIDFSTNYSFQETTP